MIGYRRRVSDPNKDDPNPATSAAADVSDVAASPEIAASAEAAGEADAFDAVAAAAELSASLGEEAAAPASAEKMLELELLDLTKALDARNAELAQANARATAAEKEIDQVKTRLERDSAKQVEAKSRKFLLAFLEVLDDLDRALVSVREDVADGDATQEVVRGVELVRSSFLTKLSSFGVTHRPSLGEAFDPVFHEAFTQVAVTDPAQNGTVMTVLREGYMIGEELLRAAGVAVGKA